MDKWVTLAGGILGGFGLGVVLSVFFAEKQGVFCPVCNGQLIMKNKGVVCKSCGLRLKEEAGH
ncbi:hypothetical protein ACFLXC_02905 [Chloroflexota bacterium]